VIDRLKRGAVYAVAGAGLLIAGVLALGMAANTVAALWDARGQFVFVAAVAVILVLAAWLSKRRA